MRRWLLLKFKLMDAQGMFRTWMFLSGFGVALSAADATTTTPNSGLMPDGVSVPSLPRAPTEGGAAMAIMDAMLQGSCFLPDFKVGADTCTLLTGYPMACVRFTTHWPFGIMESSDKYGHTGLNFDGHLKSLRQAMQLDQADKNGNTPASDSGGTGTGSGGAGSGSGGTGTGVTAPAKQAESVTTRGVMAITKNLSPIYSGGQQQADNTRTNHSLGRALPPPMAMTAVAAILEIVTFGQFCSADFLTTTNWGTDWFLADADRGPSSAWRGTVSSYMYDTRTSGEANRSVAMTFSGLSMADVWGLYTHGQNATRVGRSSSGYCSQVGNLLQSGHVAWQLVAAPIFFWNVLHTERGGVTYWDLHDPQSISASGRIAAVPKLIPGTKVQNMYPGDALGCPEKDCGLYDGTGTFGTQARFLAIPIAEQRSSSRGPEKTMAVLLYPYFTCCRLCMGSKETITRQLDAKAGNEFNWGLALRGLGDDNSGTQEESDKQKKTTEDKITEMREKRATQLKRKSELSSKATMTAAETEEMAGINKDLGSADSSCLN